MSVDIVIINANVQALDEARDSFSAVGIDDGKIAFLGSDKAAKKIANSKTRVIDAKGHVVLPGFIDAHSHFAYMGVREGYLDLSDTASKHEALARIKKFALSKDAGQWVIGSGWDESHWSDSNEYMNKEELDSVAPDNPVLLRRVDGHLD
ncbi:MAG TPA: amidohydrolase, partial [Candidatus Acetothermia bacterium]|nr:amidohydrolase [Candidatus Acetothermia bacterium]HEX32473.1 amidohydrolase [Candidatus Acetothermia bacterium]